MNFNQKLLQTIKHKYQAFSLRSKISLSLISMVLVICGLVMLASYAGTRYLMLSHSYELLNSKALLEQRELEIKLSAEIQSAVDFAGSAIVSRGLTDARERTLYLNPFLKNQRHAFANTGLTVVNDQGRAIASNLEDTPDYSAERVFNVMLQAGKLQIDTSLNANNSAVLLAAVPLHDASTNDIQGALVLEIPLESLLTGGISGHFHWLVDAGGLVIAGQRPDFDKVIVSAEHKLQMSVPDLHLGYFLAHDRDAVLNKTDIVLYGYLAIALAAVIVVLIFAKLSTRYILRPLENLSGVVQDITASGRPQSRISIDTNDEYGALATAFNDMFARLDEVYADLDACVQSRTRELEDARNLLHEAVGNITQGFCIFDQQDRLLIFNEAYKQYTTLGDFVEVGRTYQEILETLATAKTFDLGCYSDAEWVQQRLAHHRKADSKPFELRRLDGRWFMAQEIRSPRGYTVGTRIEITELKNVTDALMQRELYLRATLDNLPFLFWLKDQQSHFLAVNKVFSDACGLARPEDAVGKTDFDVWPQDLAEQYRADDFEVIASMKEKQVEEPMDGSYGATWIETYKKPVMTADGKVMGTVGFARDISDRKRVELALAEAEQRWSMAVRGANDGIWDWNLQTGKVYYSERWKTMLGYGKDEISDSPDEWKSRIHPDDCDRMLGLIREHMEGKSEFYTGEHRLRRKDGSYKWVLTRGKALIDKDGNTIRISGSHTDISDKKLAEAIILDRTQQLDAIFSLSPDGFVSFDEQRRFKFANQTFYQLTGLDPAKLIGVDEEEFSQLLAQQCKDSARFLGIGALRAKLGLSSNGNSAENEAIMHNEQDGQVIELTTPGNRLLEVSLRSSKAPTVSEILYIRDVTYEVEVSRIKSEFLSTAAHELRTPMSSIYGYSELLLAREFSPEQQRKIHEVIHKQAILVSEILNELLDLQRIESRRGKDFVLVRLDVEELIKETLAMFKVPDGRVAPRVTMSTEHCFISADRSKMIQVVNNVLSNAYKYSPAGGDVLIDVIGHGKGDHARFIGIKIQDHGIGMKPEQLARVFERFYRADSSGTVPGTGLGMSIVKEIVELHHGHVDMASHFGEGTAVTLWFPEDIADQAV